MVKMQRKIIQIAKSTKVISIPKEWVELNKIAKGDSVELEIKNNDLIIRGKPQKTTVSLDFTGFSEDLIWRHLISLYRKGVDIAEITYREQETFKILQNFVKDLLGWGITQHTKDKIVIKELISNKDTNMEEILNKMFSLLIELGRSVSNGLKARDSLVLKNIPSQDYNINRFANLCLRLINKNHYENKNSLYVIITALEEIGDEYRNCAILEKFSSETLNLFDSVNALLEDYYELYSKFDKERLINFYKKTERIIDNMEKIKKQNPNDAQLLNYLRTIIYLIKSLVEETMVLRL